MSRIWTAPAWAGASHSQAASQVAANKIGFMFLRGHRLQQTTLSETETVTW